MDPARRRDGITLLPLLDVDGDILERIFSIQDGELNLSLFSDAFDLLVKLDYRRLITENSRSENNNCRYENEKYDGPAFGESFVCPLTELAQFTSS